MDITFRRDPTNYRPRINKWKSQKDQEQKAAGNYFLMDDSKLSKEEEEEEKAAGKTETKKKPAKESREAPEKLQKKPKGRKTDEDN